MEFVIATVISFLVSQFPLLLFFFSFFFFRFFISIFICVHCCRRRLCRRHYQCHRIIVSVIYLCELFLVHPQEGRTGMAVLALRVLQTLQFVACR